MSGKFKRVVRKRMKRTGEKYQAAWNALQDAAEYEREKARQREAS
jgi:hypothetical protein